MRGPVSAVAPDAAAEVSQGRFIDWLLRGAGADPSHYRRGPLHRRMPACLRHLKAASEHEARQSLSTAPALFDHAANALLIGVTSFLRDAAVFESLGRIVSSHFADHEAPLRILSAGCSNGAELISTAMVLAEAGLLERSSFVGVDCRRAAIAEARGAAYTTSQVLTMPERLRLRYFSRLESGLWRPAPSLMARTSWLRVDVTRAMPAGPWDIVLCRNLSIYLNERAAADLWTRIATELAPGGLLIVGQAERPPASLGFTSIGKCLYLSLPFRPARG
jgi:chemotaxis methyl-accepting protein methylase